MARTMVNAMLTDDGWHAMTMLDWPEGRIYEIAPGTKVRILPFDVPVAIEASLRTKGLSALTGCSLTSRDAWASSRPVEERTESRTGP